MTWTLARLLEAADVPATLRGEASQARRGEAPSSTLPIVTGVTQDTRLLRAGDLFCCRKGELIDGHDLAGEAVAAGAVALLVERFVDVDVAQARVDSVAQVMGVIGATLYGDPTSRLPVAAVTGTSGKTTVTYLVESMISAAGGVPGVLGTVSRRVGGVEHEARIGTPEAPEMQGMFAWMLDQGATAAVIEATSDGLERGRLKGTRVHTAGFTNLSQDHLNTHGSMENYFAAKALLFTEGYTTRAVINAADPYGRRLLEMAPHLETLTYAAPGSDIVCSDFQLEPDGTQATIDTPGGSFTTRMHLVGRFNVDNLMCATGLALHLGLPLDAIAAGAGALTRSPGRMDRVEAGQDFTVLIDYAHKPGALEEAVNASRELAGDHKLYVVFGCGGDRDRSKRPLMAKAATAVADLTIITSDNPRTEDPLAIIAEIEAGAVGPYEAEPDRRAAIGSAIARAHAGDVVLIAGKGHETGQKFGDHTIPFDDREVAIEALGRGRP